MRLYFRPFLGLTITTVISLILLLTLGTWQYQRLQWKTDLLSEVEAASTATPFKSFRDVTYALDAGEPVDFRRIEFESLSMSEDPFDVFTPEKKDVSWRQFFPMKQGSYFAFVDTGLVSDAKKNQTYSRWNTPRAFAGYVRKAQPKGRFSPESLPDDNQWFGFNHKPETHNWNDLVNGDYDMRYYIETVAGETDADGLPARKANLRNNHFDYMLTWYGLAFTLLVMYLIFHYKAGRLRFS